MPLVNANVEASAGKLSRFDFNVDYNLKIR